MRDMSDLDSLAHAPACEIASSPRLAMTSKCSIHPQRLELAMERRALHADELGGAPDIAAEAADLRLEIFALKRLACLAQGHPHQVLAAIAGRHARNHGANVLRQHAGADDRVGLASGEDHQPLHIVAELPDIAGPVV